MFIDILPLLPRVCKMRRALFMHAPMMRREPMPAPDDTAPRYDDAVAAIDIERAPPDAGERAASC